MGMTHYFIVKGIGGYWVSSLWSNQYGPFFNTRDDAINYACSLPETYGPRCITIEDLSGVDKS